VLSRCHEKETRREMEQSPRMSNGLPLHNEGGRRGGIQVRRLVWQVREKDAKQKDDSRWCQGAMRKRQARDGAITSDEQRSAGTQ
jgi:hypothetical protein